MPVPGKSREFSNGSEYEFFSYSYCFRCRKFKTDKSGIPTQNSCKIEKQMFKAGMMDDAQWPDEIVQTESQWHHCIQVVDDKTKEIRKRVMKPMQGQIGIDG